MEKYVLCYGDDQELLNLRKLVLERAGVRVLATAEPEALRQMAKMQQISLLIVGHSLTEKECRRALDIARSCDPPLKTLTLFVYTPACAVEPRGEMLDALEGPQRLIEKVAKMLGAISSVDAAGHRSLRWPGGEVSAGKSHSRAHL
jgi:hypothetical protein